MTPSKGSYERRSATPQPRRVHLVGRRPAARRLQAVRVRPGDPAARRAAPPRLRARADEGRRSSSAHAALEGQGRERRARPPGGRGRAVLQHVPARLPPSSSTTRRTSPATSAPTSPASPPAARDVIEKFDFDAQIDRLDRGEPPLPRRRASSPRSTSTRTRSRNVEMGYLYEELIRRFSELSNETAGEHFTPREVIRLMVEPPLHRGRRRCSRKPGIVRTLSTRPAAPAGCSRSPRTTCAS